MDSRFEQLVQNIVRNHLTDQYDPDICPIISENLALNLKDIIEKAKDFQKKSKRKALKSDDIQNSLQYFQENKIYGASEKLEINLIKNQPTEKIVNLYEEATKRDGFLYENYPVLSKQWIMKTIHYNSDFINNYACKLTKGLFSLNQKVVDFVLKDARKNPKLVLTISKVLRFVLITYFTKLKDDLILDFLNCVTRNPSSCLEYPQKEIRAILFLFFNELYKEFRNEHIKDKTCNSIILILNCWPITEGYIFKLIDHYTINHGYIPHQVAKIISESGLDVAHALFWSKFNEAFMDYDSVRAAAIYVYKSNNYNLEWHNEIFGIIGDSLIPFYQTRQVLFDLDNDGNLEKTKSESLCRCEKFNRVEKLKLYKTKRHFEKRYVLRERFIEKKQINIKKITIIREKTYEDDLFELKNIDPDDIEKKVEILFIQSSENMLLDNDNYFDNNKHYVDDQQFENKHLSNDQNLNDDKQFNDDNKHSDDDKLLNVSQDYNNGEQIDEHDDDRHFEDNDNNSNSNVDKHYVDEKCLDNDENFDDDNHFQDEIHDDENFNDDDKHSVDNDENFNDDNKHLVDNGGHFAVEDDKHSAVDDNEHFDDDFIETLCPPTSPQYIKNKVLIGRINLIKNCFCIKNDQIVSKSLSNSSSCYSHSFYYHF